MHATRAVQSPVLVTAVTSRIAPCFTDTIQSHQTCIVHPTLTVSVGPYIDLQ